MKGVVFTEFLELIENKFGYDMVDIVIESAKLPHNGIYTSGGTYPHAEMISLVMALSQEAQVAVPDLLVMYGEHLFARLIGMYPHLADGCNDPLDFMARVDNYIHVEVRKLYPDAELPKFMTVEKRPDLLVLDYVSSRGMQDLGLGLMKGCANFFKMPLNIYYQPMQDKGIEKFRFFISPALEEN
ncbi:MAG: hypothetical protein EAZ57_09930 [Cytophagales bacterium]|nr:MAG: hypothetical protein EAZ67_10540 [Cytophagales bacterium]TAF59761.1 MAG: hypothetical protein EAZ57_09930 [Cytophagales bacterium]